MRELASGKGYKTREEAKQSAFKLIAPLILPDLFQTATKVGCLPNQVFPKMTAENARTTSVC